MRKKHILLIVAILILSASVNAYDTFNVHPAINKSSLAKSNASNILSTQLGFQLGTFEKFTLIRV